MTFSAQFRGSLKNLRINEEKFSLQGHSGFRLQELRYKDEIGRREKEDSVVISRSIQPAIESTTSYVSTKSLLATTLATSTRVRNTFRRCVRYLEISLRGRYSSFLLSKIFPFFSLNSLKFAFKRFCTKNFSVYTFCF